MLPDVVLLLSLSGQGAPLWYWGARPPVIVAEPLGEPAAGPRVSQVHAVRDGEDLVLRFTFDRPVSDALREDAAGTASGRLSAVLYVDADDDRATGLASGPDDLRSGAERRLELSTLFLGADPEEKRPAAVLVSLTLHALRSDGARRRLWRSDDQAEPQRISAHGEWVEARLAASLLDLKRRPRFILAQDGRTWDGRFEE